MFYVCACVFVIVLCYFAVRRRYQIDHDAIERVRKLVYNWCLDYNVPEDHGYAHYINVMKHAERALYSEWECNGHTATAIILAAFLHDVDDRKLKLPFIPGKYPYATMFLKEGGCEKHIPAVIEMISLVSTSINGNRQPDQRWKLIPRECDRIESLGRNGLVRCFQYNLRINNPIYLSSTPLPVDEDELRHVMVGRSLQDYMDRGGNSASAMDHIYDKLLHFNHTHTENRYIRLTTKNKYNELKTWLFRINTLIKFTGKFDFSLWQS